MFRVTMKTSVKQFEIMISFMEQHGDIGKTITSAKDRLRSLKLWEELCVLLNNEESGDSKTIEKWKKVWSDYKNNTKKKASRLYKAANGTGDCATIFAKLSDFEERALKIMGFQVTAGLTLEEAGLVQDTDIQSRSQSLEKPIQLPIEIIPMQQGLPQITPAQLEDTYSSQDSFHEMEGQIEPALSGQTISQAATPTRSRRRLRSFRTDQAVERRDYMEIRWGRIRIRELELQTQREWQKIALRGLDILEKIAAKIAENNV